MFQTLCAILMSAVVIFLGRQELDNISTIEDKAQHIRSEQLPSFAEAQRTLSNIETLRYLTEFTYTSNSAKERRRARVNVDALTSESVFDRDPDFHLALRGVAASIKDLSAMKDQLEGQEQALTLLDAAVQGQLMALARLTADDSSVQQINAALRRRLLIQTEDFTTVAAQEEQKILKEEALLGAMVTSPAMRDHLAAAKLFADMRQTNAERLALLREASQQQKQARTLWKGIDLRLREIRDNVAMVSADSTSGALQSIAHLAGTTWRSFLVLYAVLAFFLLFYHLATHVLVTRPIRWTAHKLADIQNGKLDTPPVAIYITELADITELLDRFSTHLTELYSNADRLKEDASQKRNLEAITQAVFQTSLDGYIVWKRSHVLMANEGTRKLLGLGADEAIGPGWYPQDLLPALEKRFFSAALPPVWREEILLPSPQPAPLPCEVTHLRVMLSDESYLLSYIRDLRQQKHTETALREAKEAAEQAAQAKSDFLARMSHEIRTPLNGVLGLTHFALKTSLSPRQHDLLTKIQSSAGILLGVINDILDFSKIEQGGLELERQPFALKAILTSLKDMLGHQALAKGLAFELRLDPELETMVLLGDCLRLTQVLLNLCSNAIKFTEHGTVRVRVTATGKSQGQQEVSFAVSDTGIGLSPKQTANLFKPFAQADTSTTRKYGGTGLGLMISKLLVELMGGAISLQSELGRGSTFAFSISLPIAKPSAIGQAPSAADAAEGPYFYGKKVLVAEDNLINQEVIKTILEGYGLEVTMAENGSEALDILKHSDFSCIFMDIQMPVMDGLAAAKAIRQQGRTLPIIAMTAHVLQEDIQKSLEAGMNAHLTKPIDQQALEACLLSWLGPGTRA